MHKGPIIAFTEVRISMQGPMLQLHYNRIATADAGGCTAPAALALLFLLQCRY